LKHGGREEAEELIAVIADIAVIAVIARNRKSSPRRRGDTEKTLETRRRGQG
jgi:hypothetical protein